MSWESIQYESSLLMRLVIASLFSAAIGYEREATNKGAGLRTHMLVALGAALFTVLAEVVGRESLRFVPANLPASVSDGFRLQVMPSNVIEAIATGVGFLGAGTIFVAGGGKHVKGLTTAASIWATAAIGVAAGLSHFVLAGGATLIVLVILRVLLRLEPDREGGSEAGGEG
jgi:putative Mg2+ transporter-C (MgtC) family protein